MKYRRPKIDRQSVYAKCNGHCGYCGREIAFKQMQVDHIFPQALEHICRLETGKDVHDFENLLPTCARCNKWKTSMKLELFRSEIAAQVSRLKLYSANFRLAQDYGQITVTESPIKFYFETL